MKHMNKNTTNAEKDKDMDYFICQNCLGRLFWFWGEKNHEVWEYRPVSAVFQNLLVARNHHGTSWPFELLVQCTRPAILKSERKKKCKSDEGRNRNFNLVWSALSAEPKLTRDLPSQPSNKCRCCYVT